MKWNETFTADILTKLYFFPHFFNEIKRQTCLKVQNDWLLIWCQSCEFGSLHFLCYVVIHIQPIQSDSKLFDIPSVYIEYHNNVKQYLLAWLYVLVLMMYMFVCFPGVYVSYMRSCTDGFFTGQKVEMLAKRVKPNNLTECAYDLLSGFVFCVTLCHTDYCNGPRPYEISTAMKTELFISFYSVVALIVYKISRRWKTYWLDKHIEWKIHKFYRVWTNTSNAEYIYFIIFAAFAVDHCLTTVCGLLQTIYDENP